MNPTPPSPPSSSRIKSIMASTRQVLDQAPPPSLRDILGAYRSRGDGDRDMLLALLNAKSAEDQRLASVAALQRTMLEIHQTALAPPAQYHVPPGYYQHQPPDSSQSTAHSSSSRSPPRPSLPSMRDALAFPVTEPPRKRHRSFRPNSSPRQSEDSQAYATQSHDLSPSPTSSSRTDSSDYSPRSRSSMAIGSLLSDSNKGINGDSSHLERNGWERNGQHGPRHTTTPSMPVSV